MSYSASLRLMVMSHTGQDVSQCSSCCLCEDVTAETGDVSIAMLLQWILTNDERALTNATTWSDEVLRRADQACANQLDLPAVLRALRDEAHRRGLHHGELT